MAPRSLFCGLGQNSPVRGVSSGQTEKQIRGGCAEPWRPFLPNPRHKVVVGRGGDQGLLSLLFPTASLTIYLFVYLFNRY